MRILLLADSSSPHTEKWATGMANQGYQIGIFSLNKSSRDWYSSHENIEILYEGPKPIHANYQFGKLSYVFALPALKRVIKLFHPDLLHAHYASSYGLLGALSGFHPFVISAWGSDIYEFPKLSFIHKAILKFNLKASDKVLSTSYVMKGELWKYSDKDVEVIPFGVDTDIFTPKKADPTKQSTIYLGTIKAMEEIYGITTIIEAVELITLCQPEAQIKVLLVGPGTQSEYYKKMVALKNLGHIFVFTGRVPFSEIAAYHQALDILLNVSTVDESFGVSVVEGMACEKPVIVTAVPGLKEVIADCGLIVEKENPQQLAKAIMQLMASADLRTLLGKAARQRVLQNYDLKNGIAQMKAVYDGFSKDKKIELTGLNSELV